MIKVALLECKSGTIALVWFPYSLHTSSLNHIINCASIHYDCKNCVVHAADETKVVVQGLDGYIIAEKHGQLLVCQLKEEQRIKEFGK